MAKKVIREVLEKGVERRKSHFRFRFREAYHDNGVRKFRAHVQTFEFLPEADCRAKNLPPNHDLWPGNALEDANAYSKRYHRERSQGAAMSNARPVVHGTLREWLERYRDEGLKGHAYGKREERAPFKLEPRADASRAHDIGQINTLLRMGGFVVVGDDQILTNPRRAATALKNLPIVSSEITIVLETPVPRLTKSHFKIILARWAKGAAAPSTKRRFKTTMRMCFQFHAENYGMEASMDWLAVAITNDGRKAKARALTIAEWAKIDQALTASKVHPAVEAALRFIRWSGCRRSEAYLLRWEQVHWPKSGLREAQPSVTFLRTKAKRGNYKERTIAIPNEAIESLRLAAGIGPKSHDWPKEGWVFPQPKPRVGRVAGQDSVSGQTVYTAFKRLFVAKGATMPANVSTVAVGVKPASPHILRHTRATELSVGMPEQQMMEYFGWDDRETVKIYRHLAEKMGLLLRDADNLLRPAAQLESEQNVLDYATRLTIKQQEALVGKLAADLAQRKTAPKAKKKA